MGLNHACLTLHSSCRWASWSRRRAVSHWLRDNCSCSRAIWLSNVSFSLRALSSSSSISVLSPSSLACSSSSICQHKQLSIRMIHMRVPQHINQTQSVSLGATKTDPQLLWNWTTPTQHNNMNIIKIDLPLQHVSESDKLNWTHSDQGNHKMTLLC